jgi:hypothetical protein
VQWQELDEEDKRLAVISREKQGALMKKKRAELVREFGPMFKHKKQGKRGSKK